MLVFQDSLNSSTLYYRGRALIRIKSSGQYITNYITMKITISNHAKKRAKERIKEITNWEESIRFLRKEFKKILKEYKDWDFYINFVKDWGRCIIMNRFHKFCYTKKKNIYTIITYCNNSKIREKETSKMMKNIRRYMREQNGVFDYSWNINNY